MVVFSPPAGQRGGLRQTKRDGRLDGIDQGGDQNAAFQGLVGLRSHPSLTDGRLRPEDDGAASRRQFLLDHLIPGLARRDFGVPPHRKAARFDGIRQAVRRFLVFTRVAQEDVAHC
jgi:hypothetical protein